MVMFHTEVESCLPSICQHPSRCWFGSNQLSQSLDSATHGSHMERSPPILVPGQSPPSAALSLSQGGLMKLPSAEERILGSGMSQQALACDEGSLWQTLFAAGEPADNALQGRERKDGVTGEERRRKTKAYLTEGSSPQRKLRREAEQRQLDDIRKEIGGGMQVEMGEVSIVSLPIFGGFVFEMAREEAFFKSSRCDGAEMTTDRGLRCKLSAYGIFVKSNE
ncbi:hypothetical protein ACLOJK_013004 [Asimina triloba]